MHLRLALLMALVGACNPKPRRHRFSNEICRSYWKKSSLNSIDNITRSEIKIESDSHPAIKKIYEYSFKSIAYAYNSSLAALDDGYLLSVRADCPSGSDLLSHIFLIELDQNLKPRSEIQRLEVENTNPEDTRWILSLEDMRLFKNGANAIFGIANGYAGTGKNRRKYIFKIGKKDSSWKALRYKLLQSPTEAEFSPVEKNWTAISGNEHSPDINLAYYLGEESQWINIGEKSFRSKKTVIATNITKKCRNSISWDDSYGGIRGGTPAIWMAPWNKYLTIFHTTVNQGKRYKKYHMGAGLIEPDSLCLSETSLEPINFSSMYQSKRGISKSWDVVFPMGLVFRQDPSTDQDQLLVTLGENDAAVKLLIMDSEELKDSIK